MRVEDIKQWQWCIIGIVVGLAVAAISQWSGPDAYPDDTIHPWDFERQLISGRSGRGLQVIEIRNIKLHPETTIMENTRDERRAEFITYTAYVPSKHNPKEAEPKKYCVFIEDVRGVTPSVLGSLKGMGARDYLDKLKAHMAKLDKAKYPRMKELTYRKAWIEEPKMAYTIFPLAGLVVVGLIWPLIVNFLVGAGFGRVSKEEGADLRKYKSQPEPEKVKPVVTADDMDKLKALEEQLEASLRDGALGATPAAPAAGAAAPKTIKKLTAAPAEPVKEASKKEPEKPKAFGAEQEDYYPTEVHGKKP